MTSPTQRSSGNLLGAIRAEADADMLKVAFVETASYTALVETRDFNFVVGRRGTGKSALFERVKEEYERREKVVVIADKPPEHHTIELQRLLSKMGHEYRALRPITKLLWQAHLMIETIVKIREKSSYKLGKTDQSSYINGYLNSRRSLVKENGVARCLSLLNSVIADAGHAVEIPSRLAKAIEIDHLQNAVRGILEETGFRVIVLYDGLDEGWTPDAIATSVIGGLAKGASDFIDSKVRIHPLIFVRDNIFRALAQFDSDFTRHIEGSTLRLHWDEASLFNFVARRLRVALKIPADALENDVKVWNRFAQRGLEDREGFLKCLRQTLYRPRDILGLLNEAYTNAQRHGRHHVIDEDVEASATRISQSRLDDLLKEYEAVFPGLKLFVSLFHGRTAQMKFDDVVELLDSAIRDTDYSEPEARDFAVLESGRDIFTALYSVGFLGTKDANTSAFLFCHDGASSSIASIENGRLVAIHPCYWKALELAGDTPPEEVMVRINDEYSAPPVGVSGELRFKMYGEVLGRLPQIKPGKEGWQDFEQWVLRSVKILFAGKLQNPALKPNLGAVQQRDIVATNLAKDGFWRRIYEDYHSRQIVIEVKNYEELEPDDFRQMLSYGTGEYGTFGMIVTRSKNEEPAENEKAWLRTMYHEHNKRLIMIIPAQMLARCVGRLRRSEKKWDYTEEQLNKRMDTLVRSHLSIPQVPKFRAKRKKKHK